MIEPLAADPVGYQVRLRPNRLACIEPDRQRQLTYGELDAKIDSGIAVLTAYLGDVVSRRIAVLGRNSLEQLVLCLACHRAGAVFVPLNWRLSSSELGVLVRDCTPSLLFFSAEFATQAREAASDTATVLVGLEEAGFLADDAIVTGFKRQTAPYKKQAAEDAPCVLLYTSGTTGVPKGVVITRSGAFFASLNFALVGDIHSDCVLMSDLPMFHTVGLFAVVRTTLTVGATLVLLDRFVSARTLARLSDPGLAVTHYFGVPQIAAALHDEPGFKAADLSRLKAFFTGGAPLPGRLVEAYLEANVILVNGYGMSEAGTVLHMPVDAEAARRAPGCVGVPAPGVTVRIVDEEGHDVEEGCAGELWLRGPAVTPGYWRNPTLTAEAFHDGWFRTGDVARHEPCGFYRLIDRRKDMYISGGENVFPAEVEAILTGAPGIQDVAIIGAAHARWGECGIAFIVARPNVEASESELLKYCAQHLARYKRPAEIHFLPAIPRTASGKIRKDVLRSIHAEILEKAAFAKTTVVKLAGESRGDERKSL